MLFAISAYYRGNDAATEFWQINPTTGETTLLHTMDYLGQCMTFSDDGELLAIGGNGMVTLLGVPD